MILIMENIIHRLYTKRYCLPSHSTCDDFSENQRCCFFEGYKYNHIACIFKKKGKVNECLNRINILTYGINIYKDIEGMLPTTHAEHDAIEKLPCLPKKKSLENVHLLVIRISKTGKLGISKPCCKCVNMLKTWPMKKGYKIQNIYYSSHDGNIVETTLKKLEEEKPHVSRFWKNK